MHSHMLDWVITPTFLVFTGFETIKYNLHSEINELSIDFEANTFFKVSL